MTAGRGDSFTQPISIEHPPYAELGSRYLESVVSRAKFCALSGGGEEQETHGSVMYRQVSIVVSTPRGKRSTLGG